MSTVSPEVTAGSQRRLVVAIGPPKTASTSLQNFLAKYVSRHETGPKVEAFGDWQYPLFFGRDNGINELEKGYDDPQFEKIQEKIQRLSPSVSLVIASERLISYDTWLNGHLWQELSSWTNVATPEIVLISRSPRISHLVSIWKQLTQLKRKPTYGLSFRDLLCSTNATTTLERRLGNFANPLGVARDLIFSNNLPTHVIDTSGVSQKNMDICHAFSCSVLKVNCTEDQKWVQGLEGVSIRSNSRAGNANLTLDQTMELERVFQERDCTYYEELHNNTLFHLLYKGENLWPDECIGHVRGVEAYRYNVTIMLKEFRRIVNCPGYEQGVKRDVTIAKAVDAEIAIPNSKAPEAAAYFILVLLSGISWWKLFARRRGKSNNDGMIISEDHSGQ